MSTDKDRALAIYSVLRHQMGMSPAEITSAAPHLAEHPEIASVRENIIAACVVSNLDGEEMLLALKQATEHIGRTIARDERKAA